MAEMYANQLDGASSYGLNTGNINGCSEVAQGDTSLDGVSTHLATAEGY